MIEIVREIIVRQETQAQFELVYGPGGVWSKLFDKSPGFRGTTVLNDTKNLRRYLIVDLWDTQAQQEQALRECADEYAKLMTDLEDWAESRVELGVFRIRAEATVRPFSRRNRRPSR